MDFNWIDSDLSIYIFIVFQNLVLFFVEKQFAFIFIMNCFSLKILDCDYLSDRKQMQNSFFFFLRCLTQWGKCDLSIFDSYIGCKILSNVLAISGIEKNIFEGPFTIDRKCDRLAKFTVESWRICENLVVVLYFPGTLKVSICCFELSIELTHVIKRSQVDFTFSICSQILLLDFTCSSNIVFDQHMTSR